MKLKWTVLCTILALDTGCCGSLKSAINAYGKEADAHGAVVIRLIEACEKPADDSAEAKAAQQAACQQAKTSVEAWRASAKTLSEVQ
jgi:hypothetical protein